jgi:hypothetical protein
MTSVRRWTLAGLAGLGVLGCGLSFSAAAAQAELTHNFLGSFGVAGPGSGAFSQPQGVAVDQSTGDVYVYDIESSEPFIYKFSPAGEPENFSALGTNVIKGSGGTSGGGVSQIAVDSSSGPTKGDIYVRENGHVTVYGENGDQLGELNSEVEADGGPWGYVCGVAVDPAGNVYVGLFEGYVDKYAPSGNPVSNSDYVSSLAGLPEGSCDLAADSEGNVYVDTLEGGRAVTKYEVPQFGSPAAIGKVIDEHGTAVAVDPAASNDGLYVDEGSDIAQYDSSGDLLGKFGASGAGVLSGASNGVAVSHSSGSVYVSDPEEEFGGGTVNIYGPAVPIADVKTEPPSKRGENGTVTLNGVVNPEGLPVSSCEFEYGTQAENYEHTAECSPAPGSGNAPVAVSAALSGLAAGITYHYRLGATDANGTNYGKDVAITPAPVLGVPTSSEVTPFSATLSDTLNPENPPTGTTGYYFEYGPTSAYGERFPVEGDAGDGSTAIPATQAITGLTPGTTYHYALVATNSAGTTTSSDQTFTTLSAAAPAVSTGAAGGVTQYEATLSGALDPQGQQTSYHFDIGADTNYGTQVFGPTVISPSTVTLGLQNLQPGTTYHYRLTATNSVGTTYGSDRTFTTAGVAPVITQPLTPLLLATPNIAFPTTPTTSKPKPKPLTRAQMLKKALNQCRKDKSKSKSKRKSCEKEARRKYGKTRKNKG